MRHLVYDHRRTAKLGNDLMGGEFDIACSVYLAIGQCLVALFDWNVLMKFISHRETSRVFWRLREIIGSLAVAVCLVVQLGFLRFEFLKESMSVLSCGFHPASRRRGVAHVCRPSHGWKFALAEWQSVGAEDDECDQDDHQSDDGGHVEVRRVVQMDSKNAMRRLCIRNDAIEKQQGI
jgi:hypothetical protein